jgi:hypothetical protein
VWIEILGSRLNVNGRPSGSGLNVNDRRSGGSRLNVNDRSTGEFFGLRNQATRDEDASEDRRG